MIANARKLSHRLVREQRAPLGDGVQRVEAVGLGTLGGNAGEQSVGADADAGDAARLGTDGLTQGGRGGFGASKCGQVGIALVD